MRVINKQPQKKDTAQKKPAVKKTQSTTQSTQEKKFKLDYKKIGYWLGIICSIGVIIGSVVAVGITMYLVDVTKNDDQFLNLTNLKLSFTSIIYYQDQETSEFLVYQQLDGSANRHWVNLSDIPQHVIDAYIAVEDEGFYDHIGFDLVGTVASAVNEYTPIQLFDSQRGASTITQQLVKNLVNDTASSGIDGALRKIREIYRAVVLERQYSKDEILEAYLNTLGLSYDWAGVQAGANNFFGKDISELTVAEAALLAGVTKNPYAYNPYEFLEDSVARRNDILYFMHEQGKIDTATYEAALAEEVTLSTVESASQVSGNSYFTDMVIDQVVEDLMLEYDMTASEAEYYLYNNGLKIYSTVVPELQSAMEEEFLNQRETLVFPFREHTYEDGTVAEPQAAMVSMDYEGRIVGVVGGLGEKEEARVLNRAVDSLRQTGSTMKPIGAYALAIDYGYINFSTTLYDDFFSLEKDSETGEEREWPVNYNGEYSQTDITVASALSRSLNTIAVRALSFVTPNVSYEFLSTTLGISSLDPVYDVDYSPLALGGMHYGVSPLEMAAAYAIFGNGGVYYEPYCYTTVEDASGEIILESDSTSVRAISEETAYIMNRLLRTVLHQGGGTGYGLGTNYMDSVGKTGTTSEDKDHWFIGLTPYYVTSTWWGYDEPAELAWKNYGIHPPTTAWRNVMNAAQADLEEISFPRASGVQVYNYCVTSGGTANPTCPEQLVGYYTEDNMPIPCPLH